MISQLLALLLYKPIELIDWYHFLPMFQSSPIELLKGAKATTFTVLGFEMLFFLYPFIGDKEKLKRPVFLGILYTTFIVLLVTCIAIGYYSLENLPYVEWSVLTLYKSISFPFIERLDYIVIMMWIMVVIPANVFLMWCMSHGVQRLFGLNEKVAMYGIALVTLGIVSFVKSDAAVLESTNWIAKIGFWIAFVYPFVLLPCVYLKKIHPKKRSSKKKGNGGGHDDA
ncbi:GerAB/ArcD/ProY family transporter [Virgibacillus halophilus]|uniref:GerAB/ArcD/ProY family transporter n=1 Tax=Tigheibacillus halophilus TaxID=361280 RepID=A0ABU5C9A9_9BACI|nr:GerAB/ArcD/ProY family transporter [Virgibacillus halophilus]